MNAPTDEVKIGDFSRPLADGKASRIEPERSPAAERLGSIEERLADESAKTEAELRPHERYEARLKDVGLSRAQAAACVDAVFSLGHYAEDVSITRRLKARFRTRQARDTERLQSFLEVVRPVFIETRNEITYKYCLAASLERYGETTFKHSPKNAPKEEHDQLFSDRLAFVEGLSEPALRILYAKLAKFDLKIATVCEEGAVENF